jgi:hypothetical protein
MKASKITARSRAARCVMSGIVASTILGWSAAPVLAQRGAAAPPQTAKAAALFDMTGFWVSVVDEDWRFRMVTPPKGDYASVPLNNQGRLVADMWDVSSDGLCDAYGAAGLMRIPTRLRIAWEDDDTLKIETDAGQQVRHLLFGPPPATPGPPSLQGQSLALWERAGGGGRRGGSATPAGDLKVVTTNLRPAWLRKNGVPYSDSAVLTEYYDRFDDEGDNWLVVTTVVQDRKYLTQEFVTTTHFKREADGSGWDPKPCRSR